MPTFAQNFQIGDVVYGVSQSRAPYVNSLGAALRQYCEDTGAFLLCDSFNNRSFLGVTQAYGMNPGTGMHTHTNPVTDAQLDHNWDYYENDRGSVALDPQVKANVKAYFDALNASRRNPSDAVNAPATKWTSKGDVVSTMLAIRRACKFGLEYVIMQKHQTVHFVLDVPHNPGTMIDMHDVVAKEKYSGGNPSPAGSVPITFSELRCCYRNRQEWVPTGRLKFYLNLNEVRPPWEQFPALWQQYDIARQKKRHPVKTYLAKKFFA
jgi:hypothetical protein